MTISNRYSAPTGYSNAIAPLINGAPKYIANNGFVQAPYAPSASGYQVATITFSAAPADGSTLIVPDGLGGSKTFTFTYGGAPGAGIIPLVAGGGTSAQAATATATALAAQLTTWTATNLVTNRVTLNSLIPARNIVLTGTQATGAYAYNAPTQGNTIPASIGGRPASLPYSAAFPQ